MNLSVGETRRVDGGLYAYRSRDGRNHYFIRSKKLFGHRHPLMLGAVTADKARAALMQQWEIYWRRQSGAGLDPTEARSLGIRVEYTLSEMLSDWLDALSSAGTDPKTLARYKYDAVHALRYLDPDNCRPMRDVTLEDCEGLRLHLRDESRTPKGTPLAFRSRKNVERTLSMLYRHAMRRRVVSLNPFDGLIRERRAKDEIARDKQKKNARFRLLHPREDAALLAAADAPWQKAAIGTALFLGVRETPVASLRLSDIDLANCLVCVPCEFNKGLARAEVREDHWVPIPVALAPLLKAQYKIASAMRTPWLFPTGMVRGRQSRSGHINPRKLLTWAREAARSIGFESPAVTFHDLRSVCANRFKAAGLAAAVSGGLATARSVTQHASAECAKPYIVGDAAALRPVIAAFDAWYADQIAATSRVTNLRAVTRP